jgi:pilus assembly protein CpaB
MKLSKGTLFMVVAGLVGLMASYGVHRYISTQTKVVVKPVSQVVVATGDISPGTVLNPAMMKTVSWPEELIPPRAVANMHQVEGRVVSNPVSAGEPVLLTKLAAEGTSAGLAALLSEGKRALSVRVDDVSGVAGFVHPGDHVDVLMEIAMPSSNEHFSKTILQNIVVLTAGQTWEQVRDQKPSVVNTVTLVLTPDQAEVLNLASNQGRIRLALRNRNDADAVASRGIATSSLMGESVEKTVEKVEKKEVAEQKPIDNARHVEVIKGLDRSRVKL